MHMAYAIQPRLEALTALCKQYGVRRLALFGSGVREDFDPERSDLDFLVEFRQRPEGGQAKAYFGLLRELETLFGRRVDLIEAGTIRNPYVQRQVEAEQKTLYAA